MAPLLAASARVRPANGGATGRNFGGALLAGFELALMAAIAQEASESAQQALRPHEVADSVRTPLAPRSQPTAAYRKCFMPTLRRSARRQAAWHGTSPLHVGHARLCRAMKILFALAFSATDQDDPRLHFKLLVSCTRHARRI